MAKISIQPIEPGLAAPTGALPTGGFKPPATPGPVTPVGNVKKYKGKYRGPDRFKGDMEKVRAYRKAKKAKEQEDSQKSYKGKYRGPDRFKGNKKKLAAYRAAKRKAANNRKVRAF